MHPARHRHRHRHRTAALAAAGALSATLSACNWGFSLSIGPDDDPPQVSLAVSPTSASPGATVSLAAAANDDYRVVEVRFYRADGNVDTYLGRDTSEPYGFVTTLPLSASGQVRYFAEAVDDAGQVSEVAVVSVAVLP